MLNDLSLFSGIGAFEKALTNLDIEYNVVAYCEIDKYASKAYSAIHNIPESKNLLDVTKVDILDIEERVDLITYGFPCQDISNSGLQKGFFDENGNRTRSGLFFEASRIIDDYRPKFAIAENVKALMSKKFSEEFRIVLESLDEIGYNNYYAVLNAKDFGIPQNRERVFVVSIRKDIDVGFTFPEGFPLELRLKDLLEDEVDEKFYLSDKMVNYLFDITEKNKVLVREATKKGYAEAYVGDSINIEQINSKTRRGRVGKGVAQTLTTMTKDCFIVAQRGRPVKDFSILRKVRTEYGKSIRKKYENGEIKEKRLNMQRFEPRFDGVSNALTTVLKDNYVMEVDMDNMRIRKLTPTEYYKLMGFTVEDCKRASDAGISNTQLYKQAGNSIVVNVLEAIFTELGKNYDEFRPGLRDFENGVITD